MDILTLNPNEIMERKPRFRRPKPAMISPTDASGGNTIAYDYVTQADFLREYDINSHKINSLKHYPNLVSVDNKKINAKVLARVAVGWQDYIHTRRVATLTGNGIDLKIASRSNKNQELLNITKEGWAMKCINDIIYEAISADGKVGDAAVCAFLDNGKFDMCVFSYEKGDTLYPVYDPQNGKLAVFGRKYTFGDTVFMDVYDDKNYIRYKETERGWETDCEAKAHNFQEIPIAYTRYGMPFWGLSQQLIDSYELSLSELAENNRAYALRILYSLGKKFSLSSTLDGTPTRIDSADPNAKVGFLEPADASKSFELEFMTKKKDILRSSHVIETPEMKAGSDVSSLAIKMMFADQYLKGLNDCHFYQKFVNKILRLFLYGYGVECGMVSDMAHFGVIARMYPYIFMSENEEVNSIVQLAGVNVLSKRSAAEEAYNLGYGVTDEIDRLNQERHDELLGDIERLAETERVKNVVNESR